MGSSIVHPLLLLSSFLLSPAAAASGDPILDTAGNPLVRGARYYATDVSDGFGVGMASLNGSCPPNVVKLTFRYGPPVMFFPERPQPVETVLVQEDETVFVMFAEPTTCVNSAVWTMEPETGLVTTGGAQAPPDSDIHFSRFRIAWHQLIGGGYHELLSCPTYYVMCSQVGVTEEGLLRGRSNLPLAVRFTKVPEDHVVSGAVHATA